MESSGLVHDFLSPESTVTSLLSSSGHLRSSLLAPEHNIAFRYKDKDYSSASATLDAYIADFERSHQTSKSLTGRLVLPQGPPLAVSGPRVSGPRVSTLRNRDVLRERLTDRELDFLNLPVSSLQHNSNRDRLSMTTDELLSIPNDGSMPVTHTSAFIQGLLPGDSLPCGFSRPTERTLDRFSSLHAGPGLEHHHPSPGRTPRSSRCGGRPAAAMLRPGVDMLSVSCHRQSVLRAVESERPEPTCSLHLPRWLTSNKTDVDCSETASMPDLKYPAWVQRCDLSEPPPLSESQLIHDTAPRPGAPSWVAELEEEDPDQTPAQVDSQQTLRDLRLQFAEQISLFSSEKSNSLETLFRDNRIESLIQKADQVLNSLSQSCGGADSPAGPVSPTGCFGEAVSPVNSEQLLPSPPSRCHPASLKLAAARQPTQAPADRRVVACGLHGNNTCKQPGPVEALKQMLFRLQAVEAELQRQHASNDRPQTQETHVELSAGGEEEQQRCPGGPSLQRALHHLSRLKVLVEEPGGKLRGDEEKDGDEGQSSSSSAERLSCTQQKLS